MDVLLLGVLRGDIAGLSAFFGLTNWNELSTFMRSFGAVEGDKGTSTFAFS